MKIIAFDTETKGFQWWAGETAFIATTSDGGPGRTWNLAIDGDRAGFKSLLDSADVIVAHNLSFDVHQVRATIDYDILAHPTAVLHDTDIMARVAWPEGSYGEHGGFGLKNLAKVFIDPSADVAEEGIKEAAKKIGYRSMRKTGAYFDVWRAYPDVMEHYAEEDARYTWLLYERLVKDLAAPGAEGQSRTYYDLEHPILPILIRAEAAGTAVDPPKVKALKKEYDREQKRLHEVLLSEFGETALGGEGSEDALEEALLKMGVPLHKRTEGGKLSTAEWALGEFVNEFPALQAYMDYRTVNKFLSTYIDPMYKRDEVHPNFRQIGTWTGRMSCARPNMQNIPVRSGPEVREVFIPRPGYKLVVADFATIEMRVLAYYLGREGTAMRDLIKSGVDTNSWIASELAATGTEPYAGAGRTPDDFAKGGPNARHRANARHALYAILYGAGACKICEQQNMEKGPPLTENDWVVKKGYKNAGEPSCKQGGDLAKKIKGAIPGYMSLMRRIQRRIEDVGYVVTLGGRKQAVARDKSYVGMAALIQGSAADIMKAALIACQPIVDRLAGRLLLIVHDEGVWEFPEAVADEALALIIEAMEGAWELDPPLKVDGTTATNYGEAK